MVTVLLTYGVEGDLQDTKKLIRASALTLKVGRRRSAKNWSKLNSIFRGRSDSRNIGGWDNVMTWIEVSTIFFIVLLCLFLLLAICYLHIRDKCCRPKS